LSGRPSLFLEGRAKVRIIPVKLPSNHDIVLSGDDHIGSHMSHDDGINQLIDRVRAENTYLVKMGDVIEAIMLDDKRYDRTARNDIPLRQAQEAIERYTPVKKKLVAWLQGNHELKLWKFGNLSQFMAEELEVPYGTYTAIIEVSDEYGLMYRLFVSHGFGTLSSRAKDAEQQRANMMAALKMKLKAKRADCIAMAMGHTHKLMVVNPTGELYLNTEDGRTKQHYIEAGEPTASYIPPEQRWYVNTGSFMRLYNDDLDVSGYGEIKGYDPTEMGFAVFKVRDRKPVDVEKVTV
jgi:UDP-2,3-diacylglucosamine pyrophosphatase LpxH